MSPSYVFKKNNQYYNDNTAISLSIDYINMDLIVFEYEL